MDLLLLIVPLIICIVAQINVQRTYTKFHKVRNARGLTGAEVARQILDNNGLNYVRVEMVHGQLTDHFDSRSNVVCLSESVYNETSVAALGVAAHECGHAVQHAENYGPIVVRSNLVPIANFCSRAWYLIFIIGLALSSSLLGRGMVTFGIILFLGVALFQLVTLPVEFNASSRALAILETQGFLEGREIDGAKEVLKAAALTYVAALLHSLLQLLRLIRIARD